VGGTVVLSSAATATVTTAAATGAAIASGGSDEQQQPEVQLSELQLRADQEVLMCGVFRAPGEEESCLNSDPVGELIFRYLNSTVSRTSYYCIYYYMIGIAATGRLCCFVVVVEQVLPRDLHSRPDL
jgi:hypothetical protein